MQQKVLVLFDCKRSGDAPLLLEQRATPPSPHPPTQGAAPSGGGDGDTPMAEADDAHLATLGATSPGHTSTESPSGAVAAADVDLTMFC